MGNVVIFGAGDCGLDLLANLTNNKSFVGSHFYLCDNDRLKWGKRYGDVEVMNPAILDDLEGDSTEVFIAASRSYREIFIQISSKSFKRLYYIDEKSNTILINDKNKFLNSANQAESESNNRIKIDVNDILLQLSDSYTKDSLYKFMTTNHRQFALLSQQNRWVAEKRVRFIEEHLHNAGFFLDQFRVICSNADQILKTNGHILDLGVYKGNSTRALADIFPDCVIHGFDSFEGLPSEWSYCLKGTFGDVDGLLPAVQKNVKLYKGWFDETLPRWIKDNNDKPISLLRVDCDIYSSTKTIFDVLNPIIVEGTWIIFDELIGYIGFEEHEFKALNEFLEEYNYKFHYVAYGLTYVAGYLYK